MNSLEQAALRSSDALYLAKGLLSVGLLNEAVAYAQSRINHLQEAGLLESVPLDLDRLPSGGMLVTHARLLYELSTAYMEGKE